MLVTANINPTWLKSRSGLHVKESFGFHLEALDTCLEFLELLVEGGQMVRLLQLGGLLLQVGELIVQVGEALHRRLGLVVLEELAGLGLGGALQVGPALSDLLQLLLNHWTQLWLLLDQLQTLLDTGSDD